MNILQKLGLFPRKALHGAFNPRSLELSYARPGNIFTKMFDGSLGRLAKGDAFGYGQYTAQYPPGNTFAPGMGQQITQPRWQEKTYTDNSTTLLTPFDTVQVSGVGGYVEAAGLIPAGKVFVCRAFRIFPKTSVGYGTTGAIAAISAANDIQLLMFNGTFELIVQAKQFIRVPLYMLPSGIGIPTGVAAAGTYTATAREVFSVSSWGVADPRGVFTLPDVLVFEGNTNFNINLAWASAQDLTANVVISTIMDGQEVRTVQ